MKELQRASIVDALIWAVAILAAAIILRGTPQAGQVVVVLGGAAGASITLLESALRKARRAACEKSNQAGAPTETAEE
jgi:hypothetical protein